MAALVHCSGDAPFNPLLVMWVLPMIAARSGDPDGGSLAVGEPKDAKDSKEPKEPKEPKEEKEPKETVERAEPAEVIEVSQLDELGAKLPGVAGRSRRSALDSDSDLFGEELLTPERPAAEPQ